MLLAKLYDPRRLILPSCALFLLKMRVWNRWILIILLVVNNHSSLPSVVIDDKAKGHWGGGCHRMLHRPAGPVFPGAEAHDQLIRFLFFLEKWPDHICQASLCLGDKFTANYLWSKVTHTLFTMPFMLKIELFKAQSSMLSIPHDASHVHEHGSWMNLRCVEP